MGSGDSNPLLREDIADAACGDPPSVSIAPRTLWNGCLHGSTPRQARRIGKQQKGRAQIAERKLAETRAAGRGLCSRFSVGSRDGVQSRPLSQSLHERDKANRQTAIAIPSIGFLSDDLLGRGNPIHERQILESLMTPLSKRRRASTRKFHDEPLVAGAAAPNDRPSARPSY